MSELIRKSGKSEARPLDRKVHYDTLEGEPYCGQGKRAHPSRVMMIALDEGGDPAEVTCSICRNVVRDVYRDLSDDLEYDWLGKLREFEEAWRSRDLAVQDYWLRHYGYDVRWSDDSWRAVPWKKLEVATAPPPVAPRPAIPTPYCWCSECGDTLKRLKPKAAPRKGFCAECGGWQEVRCA